MLVGYDANNVFRNGGELGEWSRNLVEKLASLHVADYRALLFSTRMKNAYRTYYTSYANVSSYVPEGASKLFPATWMRYGLNAWLKEERVKVFHGLNEELPYGIGRSVKTIVTCFGLEDHHQTSMMDSLLWKRRMRYAWKASDVVVAVSEEVKKQLIDAEVTADKIVVIGGRTPLELTDQMVQQYYELYKYLAGD
jgi:hypothetical protein